MTDDLMRTVLRAAAASGATWVRAFLDEPTGAIVVELGGVGPDEMKTAARVLHGEVEEFMVVSTDGPFPLGVRRPVEYLH